VDAISVASDRYVGYKLVADPFVAPATAQNGDVITVPYVRAGVNEDGDNNIWDPNGGNGNGYGGGNNPQGTGGNGGTSTGTSTKTSNSKGNGNSQ